uniref:Mitotic spindle organizing protein 2B n=1 Tax=Equus caballus TaxID=9796 RepID=A0A3Q2HDM4_HORSE|nr:mitotic-spindle organizing protein 2B-like isoform X1 [Equus caballus]
MAAPGAGPGLGASPGLEAALQKLALRRKKVLSAEEMELYELVQAAGGAMDPDVFKILLDLLKLNVVPLAVFQMLKSTCAGQRLPSESQAPAAVSLPTSSAPETRGQRWARCSLLLWSRRRGGGDGADSGAAAPSPASAWPSVARPFCWSSPRTRWASQGLTPGAPSLRLGCRP